jgi:Zn-dependent protease with chaperone function
MFSNFIYLIIILLIYSTYQPAESPRFSLLESIGFFFALTAGFAFTARIFFERLAKRYHELSPHRLDHQFQSTQTRLSIFAVFLFAVIVYGLNLPDFLLQLAVFKLFPTLPAICFITIFISYLAIIWACGYPLHEELHHSGVMKRSYILSNISISVPVLLPWLMLSGVADMINALPFEAPRAFLSKPEGEIIYFLTFLLAVAILGPAMIQKFWRCHPLEAGPYRRRIEQLCHKAGLRYANILYWPIFSGRMITAGVMGLVKRFRFILVTKALLRLLTPEEVDAVIAHEIGHVKKRHLQFYLLFFIGYLILAYALFDLIIFALIYSRPITDIIEQTGMDRSTVTSIIFSLIIILFFLAYFRYIFGYFMRNFERQADCYVYTLFSSASPLITTLGKIAFNSGQSPDRPNWHHFSISERVDYLQRCEKDKRWVLRQDRKVKYSIYSFMVGLCVVGIIGYQLNFGNAGKQLSEQFWLKIIHNEIEKSPDNPDLHAILGDLLYRTKNYEGSIAAYKRVLRLNPDNPEVLNNLAWLYCDVEGYRNPPEALQLARKAVSLKESHYILDTLAESLFLNGRIEEAIETGRRALQIAPANRDYYRKQIRKFEMGRTD